MVLLQDHPVQFAFANPAVRRGTGHIRVLDPKQPVIVDFKLFYSTDKIAVVIGNCFLNAFDGWVPPCTFFCTWMGLKIHDPLLFLAHFFSPRNWSSQPLLDALLRTCGSIEAAWPFGKNVLITRGEARKTYSTSKKKCFNQHQMCFKQQTCWFKQPNNTTRDLL